MYMIPFWLCRPYSQTSERTTRTISMDLSIILTASMPVAQRRARGPRPAAGWACTYASAKFGPCRRVDRLQLA